VWYLIEDFFEQSWIMKLFIAWGWASAIIMATSFGKPIKDWIWLQLGWG
jgi:hypothetical protein